MSTLPPQEALRSLLPKAVQVFESILDSEQESSTIRLKVAEMVLERTLGKGAQETGTPTAAQQAIDRLMKRHGDPA